MHQLMIDDKNLNIKADIKFLKQTQKSHDWINFLEMNFP